MAMTIHVEIVSAEARIFSGTAERLAATGVMGELCIYPRHAPLLTAIKQGPVRVVKSETEEEVFYIKGGILEVQPHVITILADTVTRARELDETAALAAKERAEHILQEKGKHKDDIDYARATAELAEAVAQLQTIRKLRKALKVND
jgi:F-type H+-transporting ATPase subunit epsilon